MMRIGYLHIGSPQHGVCRYGRLLAAEARRQPELSVIEVDVVLSQDKKQNRELLIKAAQQLSEAEIIHFQFNKFNKEIWGGGWSQLYYLRVFMGHCSCPLVVTLHDVFYPPYGLASVLKYLHNKFSANASVINKKTTAISSSKPSAPGRSRLKSAFEFMQSIFKGVLGPDALALREIANRVSLMFVCTEEEAQRICDRVDNRKLKVVPHFVETRSINISPAKARTVLGLEGVKVVTLLGFIYATKGHQLMVEALPELPPDVKIIFAGGSSSGGSEQLVKNLLALAKAKGVDERLRITGYLSEEELEHYLMATDLAVCPFSRFSASGSLSTWISVARPVLASDFPQVAEYNRLEPGAIKTFSPYTPAALAKTIEQLLPLSGEDNESAITRLRKKLSMSVIFDKHLSHYQNVAKVQDSAKEKCKFV
ncbi:glycosyltransferase [Lyngbya aestuarii]|uniref:glycosyltransferase n=1 Tax=Lyngbya aestuarii TaxID=118322 RepID=UPI00403E0F4E